MKTEPGRLTVGELARRTGVSVRTLHHYEAVGLLEPKARTPAGYRVYGPAEVERLQQIRSLRQLGFSLDRIRTLLDGRDFPPLRVIELHLAALQEQIAIRQQVAQRLSAIASAFQSDESVSIETMLETIEEMTRMESYYTPEQLAELEERRRQLGDEGMRQAQADWQTLIDEVRTEWQNGTDPTSERVRGLAARWQALVQAFTGGNPEIATSLQRLWTNEETVHGYDTSEMRQLGAYLATDKAPSHDAETTS